jgi:tripartite-type tricarboxylate transporter receptor subunit TctC
MNGQSVLFLAACRTVKPGRLLALAIVILLALHAGWVGAQAYPAKPIRVIVPNAPGGTSDILARLIGSKLTDAWGQRVIVDNRPGANGLIGAEMVARAAPDGYTLLLMDVGNLAISPSLYPKIPFDMLRDFAPITTLSYSPHALSTHPSVPVRSVKDLIAFAKARPGQLNAPVALGSASQLAAMMFAYRTGINWVYIPVAGSALNLVVMGEGHMLFMGMLQTLPQVNSGRLRLLAVSSAQRDPALPDIPAVAETPGLEGFVTGSWQGLLASAHTPPEVVNKINAEVIRILNMPDIRDKLSSQGTAPQTNTPREMGQWLAAEKDRWAKFIKVTGFKLE